MHGWRGRLRAVPSPSEWIPAGRCSVPALSQSAARAPGSGSAVWRTCRAAGRAPRSTTTSTNSLWNTRNSMVTGTDHRLRLKAKFIVESNPFIIRAPPGEPSSSRPCSCPSRASRTPPGWALRQCQSRSRPGCSAAGARRRSAAPEAGSFTSWWTAALTSAFSSVMCRMRASARCRLARPASSRVWWTASASSRRPSPWGLPNRTRASAPSSSPKWPKPRTDTDTGPLDKWMLKKGPTHEARAASNSLSSSPALTTSASSSRTSTARVRCSLEAGT